MTGKGTGGASWKERARKAEKAAEYWHAKFEELANLLGQASLQDRITAKDLALNLGKKDIMCRAKVGQMMAQLMHSLLKEGVIECRRGTAENGDIGLGVSLWCVHDPERMAALLEDMQHTDQKETSDGQDVEGQGQGGGA